MAAADSEVDADDALSLAWVEGADGALRAAWDRYGTLINTFCLQSLRDRELAADCLQETFVSAWRSRHLFRPDRGPLPAWLLGIARHRVHDAYRATSRAPWPAEHPPEDGGRHPTNGVHPEITDSESAAVVERLLLADALSALPARPRRVMELAFYEGFSQSEIAEQLEVPIGTVKSDMRRALARLRAALEVRP